MAGESPDVVLYDGSSNALAVQNGAAIPASTPALMAAGSDGTNSRYILIDGSGSQLIAGAAADGAAVAGNPVLIGGQDGVNAQSILTDTTGRLVIVGPSAAGTAVAGNPLQNGGVFNTSNALPTSGDIYPLQLDQGLNLLTFPGIQFATGAAWTSATSLNTLQFANGTTTIGQLSSCPAMLIQLDQTTTITGGAVTFQGTYDNINWVTIPTAQVVNPNTLVSLTNPYTFVANTNQAFLIVLQGYAAIRINLTSALTGTGSVTPYWSKLPASPFTSVGPVTVSQSDLTATGSLGALNAAVTLTLAGTSNSAMQLVAGTLIGTIVPEVSVDGGTTWVPTFFIDPATGNKVSSIVFAGSNAATTRTIVGNGGTSSVRVRVSAYTSGTATCNLRASTTQDTSLTSEGGIGGTAPPTALQIGGVGPSSTLLGAVSGGEGSIGHAIMANKFVVSTNATITTSGSQLITNNFYGVQQINLIVNVTGAITGTTPVITYTIQEVDPGNGTTLMNTAVSTGAITAVGVYVAPLTTTTSSAVKITWTVTGTTPSFGGVYVTVISKASPSTQTTSGGVPITATPQLVFGDITLSSNSSTVLINRTTYTEQTANFTGSVKSSSANDASAGTGARTIKIFYVDATGATAGTETATLNGTTAVNLVTTTKCFIEKIVVLTVGTGLVTAGTISLFTGAAGTGTLVGTIQAGDNNTYWCHHYTITGKTCNVTNLSHSNTATVSGGNSTAHLRALTLNSANSAEVQVSEFIDVPGAGSPSLKAYVSTIQVAGPARIAMYVLPGANTSNIYRGSIDCYDV